MTRPEYPGLVPRQALINWCREQVEKLEESRDKLFKGMLSSALNADERSALHSQYDSDIGAQKALRDVTEWVKNNLVYAEELEYESE